MTSRVGRYAFVVLRGLKQIKFDELESTNKYTLQHADELSSHTLTVVSAKTQTQGRGSHERYWFSPPSQNVYASYGFLRPCSEDMHLITQVMGVSVRRSLKSLGIGDMKLKWPNDLMLHDKKIGGILSEVRSLHAGEDSERRCAVCVGVGLNVNMTAEEAATIERPVWPASSLLIETGRHHDPEQIIRAIGEAFCENVNLFHSEGYSAIAEQLAADTWYLLGQHVRVRDGQHMYAGELMPCDHKGRLVLRGADGLMHPMVAGEIVPSP